MNYMRIPHQLLFGELITGKRNVGAPKMRWKDSCKRDMQQFGIKFQNQSGEFWASQSMNRRQWALLLRNGMKVHTLFSDEKAKQLQAMRQLTQTIQTGQETTTNDC